MGYHQVERVSRPPTTSFRSSDLRMRISGEEMSRRVQERRTAPPLPRRSRPTTPSDPEDPLPCHHHHNRQVPVALLHHPHRARPHQWLLSRSQFCEVILCLSTTSCHNSLTKNIHSLPPCPSPSLHFLDTATRRHHLPAVPSHHQLQKTSLTSPLHPQLPPPSSPQLPKKPTPHPSPCTGGFATPPSVEKSSANTVLSQLQR